MRLDPDEIDDGKWVAAARMDELVAQGDADMTDAIRLIWRRYRELRHSSAD